jgi:hypothetical protein
MRKCRYCRFWSEMIAEARGRDVIALCINPDSENCFAMMRSGQGCDKGKDAPYGAIDDETRGGYDALSAAYAKLDAMEASQ